MILMKPLLILAWHFYKSSMRRLLNWLKWHWQKIIKMLMRINALLMFICRKQIMRMRLNIMQKQLRMMPLTVIDILVSHMHMRLIINK